ncbi:MAG: EAL domain-containing protein [Rhodobacterales bacterium]|nr:EAL domain-containing protein [Rhodobacterales bacterium]
MRGLDSTATEQGPPLNPFEAALASRDMDVPAMVRAALARNRGQLAFQPIVTACNTRKIAYYEGLIRLLDDGNRIIPAGQFIASVEETTMGRDVDCVALALGLEKLRVNPALRLSVNMSARSIGDGKWRRTLDTVLNKHPALGPRLILEMSESSAMMLPEVVIRFMAELQPRGVSFALDDFGAGQIAFRYLKDFFFDMVKIDRHFIRNIDSSPDNQVIAEALITVAHQFEMFTVAEGVETEAEAALLTRLGIDCLQGYLFGVPKATL